MCAFLPFSTSPSRSPSSSPTGKKKGRGRRGRNVPRLFLPSVFLSSPPPFSSHPFSSFCRKRGNDISVCEQTGRRSIFLRRPLFLPVTRVRILRVALLLFPVGRSRRKIHPTLSSLSRERERERERASSSEFVRCSIERRRAVGKRRMTPRSEELRNTFRGRASGPEENLQRLICAIGM